MPVRPRYEVSIKIEPDNAPGQKPIESMVAAREAALQDLAGIIQGFKLLKYKSNEQVDIKNIEDPDMKAGIIQGIATDYNGGAQGKLKIKLDEGRKEISIPISRDNLRQIMSALESANVKQGNTEALLTQIESGLEKVSAGGAKYSSQPQVRRR